VRVTPWGCSTLIGPTSRKELACENQALQETYFSVLRCRLFLSYQSRIQQALDYSSNKHLGGCDADESKIEVRQLVRTQAGCWHHAGQSVKWKKQCHLMERNLSMEIHEVDLFQMPQQVLIVAWGIVQALRTSCRVAAIGVMVRAMIKLTKHLTRGVFFVLSRAPIMECSSYLSCAPDRAPQEESFSTFLENPREGIAFTPSRTQSFLQLSTKPSPPGKDQCLLLLDINGSLDQLDDCVNLRALLGTRLRRPLNET